MPIENLTTRDTLVPRYPILGKFHKGGPKDAEGRVGEDLDYFRFVGAPGKQKEEIEAAVLKIYGPEPDSLDVRFPLPTMEDVFGSWREAYTQSRLLRLRCNGKEWVYWIEGHQVCRGRKPCPLEYFDPDNRCPNCPVGPVGRLSIYLEPVWRAGFIGLITVETHSINDLIELGGALISYEPLTGKVFRLFRRPKTVGAPLVKQNRRIAVEKSLLGLELQRDWALMLMASQDRKARALLNPFAEAAPAGPVPAPASEEAETPVMDDEDTFEGVIVEEADLRQTAPVENPPPPPEPSPDRQPRRKAPASPDPDARLDRENRPTTEGGWTEFYQWSQAGGYSNDAAFAVIKSQYPNVRRNKMCTVEEAVGALLTDEDYRLSGEESPEAES